MLFVNLAMFGLYILSLLVYYIVYTMVYFDNHVEKKGFVFLLGSNVISAICSAIAQLCLCAICWKISTEDQEKQPSAPRTFGLPLNVSNVADSQDFQNKASQSPNTSTTSIVEEEESRNEGQPEADWFDEESELQARLWN